MTSSAAQICGMDQETGIGPVVHVVDDDAGMRKALSTLLMAAGYEVRAYASAGDVAYDGPRIWGSYAW